MGARNWEICRAITCHALAHGLPWCAAGDWNMEPAMLRASGWLSAMDADVLTAAVVATTHAGGREGRHIDYFVASRTIAALGPVLTLCADATIRTHDAIRMRLPAAPRTFTIRRMVRAKPFPREMPIGPRMLIKTPAEAVITARAARVTGESGDVDAAAILIDQATAAALTHMEEVLAEAYMIPSEERSRYTGRAQGVKYVMGPLIGPRTGRHGEASAVTRRIRTIQDRATAVAAAARRQIRNIASATLGDGSGVVSSRWDDILERGRAAISTGHYAAAVAMKRQGDAETICSAYATELKGLGKWVESSATYEMGIAARVHASGGCGRRLDGTALHHGCGQCPTDMAPRDNPSIPTGSWLHAAADWADDIAARAASAAEPCEAVRRNEKIAAVREWASEASAAGAAMAHRWTKIPEEWRPETVGIEVDGVQTITVDPGAVVDKERTKWEALWRPPGSARTVLRWGEAAKLSRPTVGDFRRAARKFPRKTGVGVEGITPSDFDALDDDGVDALIDILMACEAIGYIPRLLALVIVKLIPQKDGGRRPIGLMPSLYRIWAKIRAGDVRDWERRWSRRYFAAGPGKSAEMAAWNAALRAEIAAASRADSASILWDLLKCFEHGQHEMLADEVHHVEFLCRDRPYVYRDVQSRTETHGRRGRFRAH